MATIVIHGGRRVKAPIKTERQKAQDRKLPAVKAKPPAAKTTVSKIREDLEGARISGLSLKALYRAAPAMIRNSSQEVVIRSLRPATTKGGLPAVRAVAQTPSSAHKTRYKASIIGKEKDIPLYKQKHVLVSCECYFFLYYCEVALNHWGSAVIKYSNGAHPKMTNPQLHPLLCKHLYRLADIVLEDKM
jgi:hypothetical protein